MVPCLLTPLQQFSLKAAEDHAMVKSLWCAFSHYHDHQIALHLVHLIKPKLHSHQGTPPMTEEGYETFHLTAAISHLVYPYKRVINIFSSVFITVPLLQFASSYCMSSLSLLRVMLGIRKGNFIDGPYMWSIFLQASCSMTRGGISHQIKCFRLTHPAFYCGMAEGDLLLYSYIWHSELHIVPLLWYFFFLIIRMFFLRLHFQGMSSKTPAKIS